MKKIFAILFLILSFNFCKAQNPTQDPLIPYIHSGNAGVDSAIIEVYMPGRKGTNNKHFYKMPIDSLPSILIRLGMSGGTVVRSVTDNGSGVVINNTDPLNPIVEADTTGILATKYYVDSHDEVGVDSVWRKAGVDSIFWKKNGVTYSVKDSIGSIFSPDSITAHAWSLQGNSGIDTSISFIGTTDAMPLMLRINNNRWGGFGIVDGSIFLGENAGNGATNANFSNFLGSDAGNGATNANFSNFLGSGAGNGATDASNSNFLGQNAGNGATNAFGSNFLGSGAGNGATDASNSNFLGQNAGNGATNANTSNFLGQNAGNGATDANTSNFIGSDAGNGATNAFGSNFLGSGAGNGATDASNSNFLGSGAGSGATNANNSIFLGNNAGYNDVVNNSSGGTSILIGDNTSTGGFSNSIAIGKGATNTAANQLYISDDITETVTAGGVTIGGGVKLNGIPAYANDAAAGAGGLSTGSLYQTSGAGAAPLNVAGILMIKQ